MTETRSAGVEPAALPEAAAPARADLDAVALELRGALAALVHALAGRPPRPVRLTQGIGLDKSLASRLVQALREDGEGAFLHRVPSPTGLRILLERARGQADAVLLERLGAAVHRFEALLDRLPGGRQALDARIGDGSAAVREKREQLARQGSFKSVSFLFGHYCETLATALLLLPSRRAGWVDAIEVHRRIGLQRLSTTMALPLLSLMASDAAAEGRPAMLPLGAERPSDDAADYLLGTAPGTLALDVVRDGPTLTFVLPPGEAPRLPPRITTAWRVTGTDRLQPETPFIVPRNYMLHTPCRTLVRDIFLAPGLWPDARPQVGFYLPGPSGSPFVAIEPGTPHLRRVNLTARIEQLPDGARGFELDGVADQRATIEQALARAGLGTEGWRGWRCRMTYPVPLIEMQLALRFAGR